MIRRTTTIETMRRFSAALLILIAGTVLSEAVYTQLIVPRLHDWARVPTRLWVLHLAPLAFALGWIGWHLRAWREVLAFGAGLAVVGVALAGIRAYQRAPNTAKTDWLHNPIEAAIEGYVASFVLLCLGLALAYGIRRLIRRRPAHA